MNAERLQRWIDEMLETSAQQWVLHLLTFIAPLGALLAVTAEVGRWWPLGLVVVPALAAASALRPDSDTALITIAVIAGHWLSTVDRVDTLWLPVASICLLAYHALCALAAAVPTGGELPAATLRRWAARTGIVGAATVAMWVLVVLLDRRDLPGNGVLTALALALVAGAAVAIRHRSVEIVESVESVESEEVRESRRQLRR